MAEKHRFVVLGLSEKFEMIMCLCKGESTRQALVYGVGRTTVSNIKHNAGKIENFICVMQGVIF
jgi:hypothetical protein